jgi:hypothetical protein
VRGVNEMNATKVNNEERDSTQLPIKRENEPRISNKKLVMAEVEKIHDRLKIINVMFLLKIFE